jgi:protein-tyrosine phosphatase
MAEGILRKLVSEDLASNVPIESMSAGTMGMTGMPPTQMAVEVSAEYGVDISSHLSQGASRKLLHNVDLILALADDHHEYCRELAVPVERVFLLRDFPNTHGEGRALSVPDPIGQARDVYRQVYFQIDEALRKSYPEIVKRARARGERSDE